MEVHLRHQLLPYKPVTLLLLLPPPPPRRPSACRHGLIDLPRRVFSINAYCYCYNSKQLLTNRRSVNEPCHAAFRHHHLGPGLRAAAHAMACLSPGLGVLVIAGSRPCGLVGCGTDTGAFSTTSAYQSALRPALDSLELVLPAFGLVSTFEPHFLVPPWFRCVLAVAVTTGPL